MAASRASVASLAACPALVSRLSARRLIDARSWAELFAAEGPTTARSTDADRLGQLSWTFLMRPIATDPP
jgi:hypothetical protein